MDQAPFRSSDRHPDHQAIARQASVASFASSSSSSTFPTTATLPQSAIRPDDTPPPSFPLTLNSKSKPGPGFGGAGRLGLGAAGGSTTTAKQHNSPLIPQRDPDPVPERRRTRSNIFNRPSRKPTSTIPLPLPLPTHSSLPPPTPPKNKPSTPIPSTPVSSFSNGRGRASADDSNEAYLHQQYHLAAPLASSSAYKPSSAPPGMASFDPDSTLPPRTSKKMEQMFGVPSGDLDAGKSIGENWDGWNSRSASTSSGRPVSPGSSRGESRSGRHQDEVRFFGLALGTKEGRLTPWLSTASARAQDFVRTTTTQRHCVRQLVARRKVYSWPEGRVGHGQGEEEVGRRVALPQTK